eukprot:4194403-Alexandrium_andersonii.AAC.1
MPPEGGLMPDLRSQIGAGGHRARLRYFGHVAAEHQQRRTERGSTRYACTHFGWSPALYAAGWASMALVGPTVLF